VLGLCPGGPLGWRSGEPAGSGGVGVVAFLFLQCIVAWRRLVQARDSGC
jgi:hypothetical protein